MLKYSFNSWMVAVASPQKLQSGKVAVLDHL